MSNARIRLSRQATRIVPCAGSIALRVVAIVLTAQPVHAGVIVPAIDVAARLSGKLSAFRAHDVVTSAATGCGGFGGIFDNDGRELPADERTRLLQPEAAWEEGWVTGIDAWSGVASSNDPVDPSRDPPIVRTAARIAHEQDVLSIGFDQRRMAIDSILGDPTDLFRASIIGESAGVAALSVVEDFEGKIPFELRRSAVVRVDSLIQADDVRTMAWAYRSQIRWTLESRDADFSTSCELELSELDQGLDLDEPRTPSVNHTAMSSRFVHLDAGSYSIRMRFRRLDGNPQAGINGCQEQRGAWAAFDRGSIELTVANAPDLDDSGTVDFGDAAIVLLDYGACVDGCASDLDGSHEVDFGDIAMVLLAFNDTTPPPSDCP